MSAWQDIPADKMILGYEIVLVRKPRHLGGWSVEIARKTPSGWRINPFTWLGIEGYTQWHPIPP